MAKSATAARSKTKRARKPREGGGPNARPLDDEAPATTDVPDAAEAERSLGRWVGRALPVLSVVVALGVGAASSLGPALLVLAAGTLLGTIALFWASVRTLAGDAPLPRDLEALAARRHAVDDLEERKQRILRALKDIEHEHAVGKINDDDYEEVAATYREQAKDLMRERDADLEPLRERAEQLARQHMQKRGLQEASATDEEVNTSTTEEPENASGQTPAPSTAEPVARIPCASCETQNEPDAAFCKKCGASLPSGSKDESDAPA